MMKLGSHVEFTFINGHGPRRKVVLILSDKILDRDKLSDYEVYERLSPELRKISIDTLVENGFIFAARNLLRRYSNARDIEIRETYSKLLVVLALTAFLLAIIALPLFVMLGMRGKFILKRIYEKCQGDAYEGFVSKYTIVGIVLYAVVIIMIIIDKIFKLYTLIDPAFDILAWGGIVYFAISWILAKKVFSNNGKLPSFKLFSKMNLPTRKKRELVATSNNYFASETSEKYSPMPESAPVAEIPNIHNTIPRKKSECPHSQSNLDTEVDRLALHSPIISENGKQPVYEYPKRNLSKGKTVGKYSKPNSSGTTGRLIVILLVVLICLVALGVAILLFGRDTGKSDLSGNNQSDVITATTPIEPIATISSVAIADVEATMDTTPATMPTEITAATVAPTEPTDPFAEYDVGDYITFGSYEQDNNSRNGTEAIEWLILDKQSDKMLVISRYALDSRKFHTKAASITWENSSIRTWLNRAFYNIAFSSDEQTNILTSLVTADKNPKYNTKPGADTQDKIFLLSISEVEKYLPDNQARFCKPTAYALEQGAYANASSGGNWWLMRTPGDTSKKVASTNGDGSIDYDGGRVQSDEGGVRPAMWIDIASWEYPERENSNTAKNSEYILPFSSERLLTEEDISFLSQEELKIARNEIFARYGRLFEDQDLQAYFDAKEWYTGSIEAADFSQTVLSSIEEANVKFLKKHEKPVEADVVQLDAKTLKAMAYGETTVSQLRQSGFELTFERHLEDGLADIYKIKGTNVLLALGRNAYGIVDEPVVVAISAPANLVAPDRIGLINDAFEEDNIIFVPDGKICGDVGTGLFFGFPEEIPIGKITKDTNVCFTGTEPPATSYSWFHEIYIDLPYERPVSSELIKTPDTQLQDWQTAYLDYLEKYGDGYPTYALAYVDDDAIPELYLSGICEAYGDIVCAYKNGAIVKVDLCRTHGGRYMAYGGKLININGNMGCYYTDIYTLTNVGFTNIFSGLKEEVYIGDENKTEVEDANFTCNYSIGDREVSKEEFDAAIGEVFNLSDSVYFHEHEVSYNQIVQKILNW